MRRYGRSQNHQDGVSIFAHKKLRGLLKTPILQTEHIFGLEQHVDFIAHGSTDSTITHLFHRKIGEYPCSDVPTVPLANTSL